MTVIDGATVPLQPAQRLGAELQVGRRRQRHRLVAVLEDRDQAPDDQDHHHHGGDLHDAQRLLARFVHADDVLAPEVERHHDGEGRREIRRVRRAGRAMCRRSPVSLIRPPRYRPALTALMGPVST